MRTACIKAPARTLTKHGGTGVEILITKVAAKEGISSAAGYCGS